MTNKLFASMALVTSLIMADAQAVADAAMKAADVEGKFSSNANVAKASKELSQSINLGFAAMSGPIESTNVNGKYIGSFTTTGYNNEELKVAWDAAAYYNEINGADALEEYSANLGVEQQVYNGWLGYAMVNWYRNEALGFENKTSIGAGVGKVIYKDAKRSLKLKVGVAQNFADFAGTVNIDSEDYATINQYLEYNCALSATSSVYAKVGASEKIDNMDEVEGLGVIGINFVVTNSVNVSVEQEFNYNGLEAFEDVLEDKTQSKTVVRVGYNF